MENMNNRVVLLGYQKSKNKNGKDYCRIHVSKPFPEKWSEWGCCGSREEQFFVPKKCIDLIKPEIIGKEIDLKFFCNEEKREWFLGSIELVK